MILPASYNIVVFAHNEAQRIRRCLAGLLDDAPDGLQQIYVLINGSTDNTFQIVKDPDNLGQLAKIAGFSLHAGVFADSHQPEKLERLCRNIARPAVSKERLSFTSNGKIRYELKTPYHDGTTHVLFEPLDFMAKLAALVPPPRLNLTRFCSTASLRQMPRCVQK